MSGYYPPGVTGNEYEIAGPDYEEETTLLCPECDKEVECTVYGYRGSRWAWHYVDIRKGNIHELEHQWDLPDLEVSDPDEEWERIRDDGMTDPDLEPQQSFGERED